MQSARPVPRPLALQGPCARMIVMAAAGFTSFFVTLSSLPAWIASRGTSAASAGAATTAMLAATVVCQPLVPPLLRRLSTTATVAIGLVALGLPAVFLIWASSDAGLYGICVIRGVGFAIFTVAGTFMTSEVAPPGRHGEVAGLYGLAAAIPNVAMVPISVLLLHEVGFWPIATLPIVGSLLALGGGWRRAPLVQTAKQPDAPRDTRAAVAGTLAPGAVLCAITIVGGAVVTILPIERSGLIATTGLLLFGVAGALARWQAGVRVHRQGIAWLLLGACALAIAGLLALAAGLTDALDLVTLVACAAIGTGYGAVQCLTLVSAFARTDERTRAVASAVWNAAFDAGTAIGALLIGALIATSLGFWGAFAVLAMVVAATFPAALAAARSGVAMSRPNRSLMDSGS